MAILRSPSRVSCCCAISRSRPSWRERRPGWNSVCPAAPVVVEVVEVVKVVKVPGVQKAVVVRVEVQIVALVVALVVLVRVCSSLSP